MNDARRLNRFLAGGLMLLLWGHVLISALLICCVLDAMGLVDARHDPRIVAGLVRLWGAATPIAVILCAIALAWLIREDRPNVPVRFGR
jgi:cell division protein FtsL